MEKEYFTFDKMWAKRAQRYRGFREFNDHNFMKVFERVLNTYNKDGISIERYMFHCIRASFSREFKRRLDVENYSDSDDIPDNGLCVDVVEKGIVINQIKNIMTKKTRPQQLNMFVDRYVNDLDVVTIAKIYNVTRQSVNRNISSVMCKIRKMGL